MIRNPNKNKVLWRLTAVLSLIAALVGVFNPGIYSKVVSTDLMALKKAGLGLLLIPAVFILGFTLIFSLAVSEIVKPLYDLTITIGGLGSSLILSILFLILAALHLRKLKLDLEEA